MEAISPMECDAAVDAALLHVCMLPRLLQLDLLPSPSLCCAAAGQWHTPPALQRLLWPLWQLRIHWAGGGSWCVHAQRGGEMQPLSFHTLFTAE